MGFADWLAACALTGEAPSRNAVERTLWCRSRERLDLAVHKASLIDNAANRMPARALPQKRPADAIVVTIAPVGALLRAHILAEGDYWNAEARRRLRSRQEGAVAIRLFRRDSNRRAAGKTLYGTCNQGGRIEHVDVDR